MECVLITGAGGMVGSHMTDVFVEQGVNVVGTYYKPTVPFSDLNPKATLLECDVRYFQKLLKIVKQYKPSRIFHLAAQSYPTVSWDRPVETIDVNVNGTINVFEAVKSLKEDDETYDPVVVVACSSAEYGASLAPENVPIKEETQLLPLHPYGVSKVAQDLLSYQYFRSDGIRSVRARIFNTTGPRKVNDVCADFTKRAVLIEKGKENVLKVGNLETKRAITDVRDLVVALIMLSEKATFGDVYNISGEKVYRIGEIVPIIEQKLGRKISVELDEKLLRPTDEAIIYGDSSKLKVATGWEQQYELVQTIGDMIDYWRERL